MKNERFSDVIERACEKSNTSSVAARWGTCEQNLRRWRDNNQSPKFDDLLPIIRRMSAEERLDTARVLFGEKLYDELKEDMGWQAKRILSALDDARETFRPLAI